MKDCLKKGTGNENAANSKNEEALEEDNGDEKFAIFPK
jgi:hypothetical protein